MNKPSRFVMDADDVAVIPPESDEQRIARERQADRDPALTILKRKLGIKS